MTMSDSADPVVVSGIGLVTPIGADRESTWSALLSGKRAGRCLSSRELGARQDWPGVRWMGNPAVMRPEPRLPVDLTDRVVRLGVLAALEAWDEARLTESSLIPDRIGCIVGTSKGGLHTLDAAPDVEHWECGWPSATASRLAALFDLRGPCLAPVAACATGVVAILRGVAAIQAGECDVVLSGSADDSLHPGVLASFQRLGVLARHDDPTAACRPYDRDRNGFVVGTGAGCLVLERRSHAIRRGAKWYAEIVRGRLATDPSGMTQLDPAGQALARLIELTCQDVVPDHIQLHGTGTRMNDPAECRAVRQVFGQRADSVLHASLKGALGHLLGAAGSVETALACLSLRDGVVAPCANLDHVDRECALPFAREATPAHSLQTVLKLSLGFGGHQAAILLRRPSHSASA